MLDMLKIYDRCDQTGFCQIIWIDMDLADISDQKSLYILGDDVGGDDLNA